MSELLTTIQAAARLNLSPSTLNKARLTGDGPHFVKLGASVRYRPDDLEAWIDAQVRRSTSDPGATTAQSDGETRNDA